MYKIAHFSDFHIENLDDESFDRVLELLNHAINRKVNHIVITGDIADSADTEILEDLMKALKKRNWTSPARLSIVPGNHDIFPLSMTEIFNQIPFPKYGFKKAQPIYEEFCRIVSPCCTGRNTISLISDGIYFVGKVLSENVVLALIDTTRGETKNPLKWAEGELRRESIEAIKEFFGSYPNATHKIIAMHHFPWQRELAKPDGYLNHNFAVPPVPTAKKWLRESGATYILCGHGHWTEFGEISRKCQVLMSGEWRNAVENEDGEAESVIYSYHTLILPNDGNVIIQEELIDL